jgi:polysaccharide biosynthesis transport protein
MIEGDFCGGTMHSSDSALGQYLRTIRRQAWLVALVPLLVVSAMYVVTKSQDPIRRASTEVLVGVQTRGVAADPELADFALMRTMSAVLESDGVTSDVIRRLNLDMSAADFKDRLKVDVLPETALLKVSYDSTDPRLARNVISEVLRSFRQRVDRTLERREPGEKSYNVDLSVLTPPSLQADPVGPKTGANLIFGAVAGIALGLLLAVAREALDSRLRERKEAEEWFDAPIVATLPKGMTGRPAPGVGSHRSPSPGDDRRTAALDLLRARLQFSQGGIHGPTILVADAGPDMGKSTVTANLGAALARGGKRVIVVDADVRRPRLHRSLDVQANGAPGLMDVLSAHAELDDALISIELPAPATNGAGPVEPAGSLELLTSGRPPAPFADTFTAEAAARLIASLNKRADFVILDAPPLVAAEAYPLAVQSDNVLIVARRGRTTKDQAEWARDTLDELGVKKVGVVLTDSPPV